MIKTQNKKLPNCSLAIICCLAFSFLACRPSHCQNKEAEASEKATKVAKKQVEIIYAKKKLLNEFTNKYSSYLVGFNNSQISFPPVYYLNPDPQPHEDPLYRLKKIKPELETNLEQARTVYSIYWYKKHQYQYAKLPPSISLNKSLKLQINGFSKHELEKYLEDADNKKLIALNKLSDDAQILYREIEKYKEPPRDSSGGGTGLFPPPIPPSRFGIAELDDTIESYQALLTYLKQDLWRRYCYSRSKGSNSSISSNNTKHLLPLTLKSSDGSNIVIDKTVLDKIEIDKTLK
jgi:hypothetical protein